MEEVWKDVVGSPDYAVSNLGRVKRVTTRNSGVARTILSQFLVVGYPAVNLSGQGKRKSAQVHRLVAEAFLPQPSGTTEVNHIDASGANNVVSNLEWVNASGNRQHAYDFGALSAVGEKNGHSKLTEDGVREIRSQSRLTRDVQARLSAKLGVSAATVLDVAARRT